MGVSQLQLRVSRYTVQLRSEGVSHRMFLGTKDITGTLQGDSWDTLWKLRSLVSQGRQGHFVGPSLEHPFSVGRFLMGLV